MKCDDPLCRMEKSIIGDHGLWGLHDSYDNNGVWYSKRLFDNRIWRFVYEVSKSETKPRTISPTFINRLEEQKARYEKQIQ